MEKTNLELEQAVKNFDGEAFEHLREIIGLSQEKTAQQLGVSHKTFWRWENKKNKPDNMARKIIVMTYGGVIEGNEGFEKYFS